MFKPLRLDLLMSEWEKDSKIDMTDPGREILRIPTLHSKYNQQLILHSMKAKRANGKFHELKKTKWIYYSGKMDREELNRLGWEPFKFVLKSDISVYIEGDADLNKQLRVKTYHDECVKFCENVMKELNSRTYQLREYMTWERFVQGAR